MPRRKKEDAGYRSLGGVTGDTCGYQVSASANIILPNSSAGPGTRHPPCHDAVVPITGQQPCRVVWFKSTDLRLHDHEPFAKVGALHLYCLDAVFFRGDRRPERSFVRRQTHLAADKSNVYVAHVFVYDNFWFSELPLTGLQKTGPIRARFLAESVTDLRRQLRSRGSDLIIRRGSTATEIKKLVAELGAISVHAYREVSPCLCL